MVVGTTAVVAGGDFEVFDAVELGAAVVNGKDVGGGSSVLLGITDLLGGN